MRSVKEAAWEKEEGWSSGGNNSDGGAAVLALPKSAVTKRPAAISRNSQSNYPEGPRRSMLASGNLQQQEKTKFWDASASNAQSSKPAPRSTCLTSPATQTSTQRRAEGGWANREESHSWSSRIQTQAKNEPNSGELSEKAAQTNLGDYQPTENRGPFRRTGWVSRSS